MYADPQSITVGAVAHSLPRIGSPNPARVGVFSSGDGNTTLTIRQDSTASRFRREYRVTRRKVSADPISATNKEVSTSIIIAVDEPKFGFSDAELAEVITGTLAAFTAQSRDKLLGGEL